MVVAPYNGGCWALHAEIGMTITFPGHPTSVTQYYLTNNCTILCRLPTYLHRFQVIECDAYV